jgi:hypothetical protein
LTGYSLPGTEGAEHPFWSLEGDEVGFFAEGKLKKIRATGGPVQIVSTQLIDDPRGGSWGPNGTILVGTGSGGIFKLSSGAGEMVPVTKLEAGKEGSHRWPHFLPDGKHFLFAVRSELPERRGTYIGSLDGTVQPLITGEDPSNARYVEPGFLLFMQGDTLMAQPFDADRLTRSGRATPVAQHVGRSSNTYSSFSATTSGALAWAGPNLESGRLTWFDKNGTQRAVVSPVGDYTDFRLSHSEDRLAWSLVDPKFGVPQISITEFERGTTSPFTSGPALNAGPVWSLDDSFLIFRTTRRGGTVELYKNSSAGGGKDELVLGAEAQRAAGQVSTTNTSSAALSPDGKNLVYSNAGSAGSQLWVLPLSEQKPTNLLNSEASIMHATFSPLGGLIAYTSDPRGSMQVIVETFPRSDKKWTVSTAGGYEPRWSSDGREIYYLSPDRNLMSVSVESGPVFRAPKVLFQTKVAPGINAYRRHYVVSKDGRFLINAPTRDFAPTPITVMLNWVADLKE